MPRIPNRQIGKTPYRPAVLARGRRVRRGSLMAEVGIAMLVLTVAMTFTLKITGWIGQENRKSDRQQRATLEAANLMERLSAIPFERLDQSAVTSIELSAETKRILPGAELATRLTKDDPIGGAGAKRIVLKIRWRDTSDEWTGPVVLSSWTYGSDRR